MSSDDPTMPEVESRVGDPAHSDGSGGGGSEPDDEARLRDALRSGYEAAFGSSGDDGGDDRPRSPGDRFRDRAESAVEPVADRASDAADRVSSVADRGRETLETGRDVVETVSDRAAEISGPTEPDRPSFDDETGVGRVEDDDRVGSDSDRGTVGRGGSERDPRAWADDTDRTTDDIRAGPGGRLESFRESQAEQRDRSRDTVADISDRYMAAREDVHADDDIGVVPAGEVGRRGAIARGGDVVRRAPDALGRVREGLRSTEGAAAGAAAAGAGALQAAQEIEVPERPEVGQPEIEAPERPEFGRPEIEVPEMGFPAMGGVASETASEIDVPERPEFGRSEIDVPERPEFGRSEIDVPETGDFPLSRNPVLEAQQLFQRQRPGTVGEILEREEQELREQDLDQVQYELERDRRLERDVEREILPSIGTPEEAIQGGEVAIWDDPGILDRVEQGRQLVDEGESAWRSREELFYQEPTVEEQTDPEVVDDRGVGIDRGVAERGTIGFGSGMVDAMAVDEPTGPTIETEPEPLSTSTQVTDPSIRGGGAPITDDQLSFDFDDQTDSIDIGIDAPPSLAPGFDVGWGSGWGGDLNLGPQPAFDTDVDVGQDDEFDMGWDVDVGTTPGPVTIFETTPDLTNDYPGGPAFGFDPITIQNPGYPYPPPLLTQTPPRRPRPRRPPRERGDEPEFPEPVPMESLFGFGWTNPMITPADIAGAGAPADEPAGSESSSPMGTISSMLGGWGR